jgi:hypothetical protein
MSVLVLSRRATKLKGRAGFYYKIIKQAPEITRREETHEEMALGTYHGWRIRSVGSPMLYSPELARRPELFLRGSYPEYDDVELFLAKKHSGDFEKAILELNCELSNNKHLDLEDVIWPS